MWLPVAGDSLKDNLNPIGRMCYSASTMVCVPTSLDQPTGAALGAGAAAWLGAAFPVQVVAACVVAGIGAYFVHAYRVRNAAQQMAPIDAGQPANFENWVDQASGLARVRYRGASWDARLEHSEALQPGALLYVLATDGNTLKVSARRPA